jgi:hypothetical protein
MSRGRGRVRATGVVLLVGASMLSCAGPAANPGPSATHTADVRPGGSPAPTQTLQNESPVAASPTAIPSTEIAPTAVRVEVHALGNLNVRRGPNLAFNAIAVLPKGQVALGRGRDVLSDWVMIPVPGNAEHAGWVSIMSHFTDVVGDVSALPEIEPTEWPDLAFLRNCTFHELNANPGGIVIPAVQNFPDNDVRVNPGIYNVIDLDVDGYPEVLTVEIREGSAVDIVVDGNGEKKRCPAP